VQFTRAKRALYHVTAACVEETCGGQELPLLFDLWGTARERGEALADVSHCWGSDDVIGIDRRWGIPALGHLRRRAAVVVVVVIVPVIVWR